MLHVRNQERATFLLNGHRHDDSLHFDMNTRHVVWCGYYIVCIDVSPPHIQDASKDDLGSAMANLWSLSSSWLHVIGNAFPRQNMTLKFVVDTRTSITCVHLSTAVCKSCHFSIICVLLSTKTSYQQNLHPTPYLCVENRYLSDSVHRTNQSGTHHEQLCVGTNRHANGCKGISSTDGSGDNEK